MKAREIKFRAWDKFQKKYVFEGYHVIGEVTVFGGINMEIHDTWKKRSKEYGYETTIDAWDDFIDEQFTGLEDKNKKPLYAGDIFQDERGTKYRCYNVVGGFAHSLPQFPSTFNGTQPWPLQPLADEQTVSWFESNCEIIGNINENPDLINQ